MVTGPHILRGIEVFRGKPIFYGLGSFYLQFDGGRGPTFEASRALNIDPFSLTKPEFMRKAIPAPDVWYDSLLATAEFHSGVASEIRLSPLRLTREERVRIQGSPRVARGDDAKRILAKVGSLSAAYGTKLEIESRDGDEIGVIRGN